MQIETGFLCGIGCGDGARVLCFVCSSDSAVRFRNQKIQADVDYCCVWRRAECTSLGPGLKHPLTDSNLAAKRRAEALRVVLFSTEHPSPTRGLLLLRVHSRMIRTRSHERRALGALLFLVSRSGLASTDSQLL